MPNLILTVAKKLAMDELFAGTGATLKLALFRAAWNPTAAITQYSATNEASGGNYTAGGITLTNVAVTVDGAFVRLTYTNPTFANLGAGTDVVYQYALLYRSDLTANNARMIWDLQSERTVQGGDEVIRFGTGANAPLSI